ncbi:MAG TPA: hypothetical protein VN310_17505 [Candidatus Dormibacteraeota bacterium]|jgi:hypothetical protein|nr:hypothetical protein [Candidatus Dormibacteraeota bacterium]
MLRERAFLVCLLLSSELLAQNVVVNPTGAQSIVQPAGTTLSTNSLSNITYVTPSDNWSQAPTIPATLSAGSNVIHLTVCPRGLTTQAVGLFNYYASVYIATVGTAEVALITATTCTQQGGSAGTITVTAANSHGMGYTVGTASQGVQEAIYAAPISANYTSTAQELGMTVVPPGQYTFQGQVNVVNSAEVVDFSGSVVTCNQLDAKSCLLVGALAHQANTWDVTIRNFTGQPGCNNCNFAMIEDAAQKTNFIGIGPAQPNPVGTLTNGASFGSMILVDNDQAAVIDRFSTFFARWFHCDSTFCSVAIKGNTGAGNSAVIYLSHANLNLNCGANGVDNQSGNTLHISDSVIENQAQFGVRATATFGDIQSADLDNVYFEAGGCPNPLGIGTAGLIVESGFATIKGSIGPQGIAPRYANTGATQYNYYIVAHSSFGGGLISAPFLVGDALTNQAGSIPVKWPQFGTTGTITYDVIRTSGPANSPAPYLAICGGGSTTACGTVATGLTPGAACTVGTAHICSFTDTASAATSAATSSNLPAFPTYYVAFGDGSGAGVFWPGAVVYTPAGDAVGSSPNPSGVHFDRFGDNVATSAADPVIQVVDSYGGVMPRFFAQDCSSYYGGTWISCLETGSGSSGPGATLLNSGQPGSPDTAGRKGRLIFEQGLFGSIAGGHKITLVDSNMAKTLNATGMRPTYDANDTYIGLDNPAAVAASGAQLAFGAPVSISNYIGNVGDSTSFLERLTASAKTFNVVPLRLGTGSTITQYNGLTTAGTGLAPNLGTPFNSITLSGNEPAQTIYTTAASGPGSAGNYRICITLWPTNSGTGTTTAIQGNAIAPSGSGIVTLPVGPALNAASLTNGGGACAALHVAASSAIQCSTTGYSGTGTYMMSCTVEQLQ